MNTKKKIFIFIPIFLIIILLSVIAYLYITNYSVHLIELSPECEEKCAVDSNNQECSIMPEGLSHLSCSGYTLKLKGIYKKFGCYDIYEATCIGLRYVEY